MKTVSLGVSVSVEAAAVIHLSLGFAVKEFESSQNIGRAIRIQSRTLRINIHVAYCRAHKNFRVGLKSHLPDLTHARF